MDKKDEFKIAPSNMTYDDNLIKKMIGEILSETDGVLGAKGGLKDIFKKHADPTKGIKVDVTGSKDVTVKMKLYVEKDKNIPTIVNEITAKIRDELQNTAGLNVKDVSVEVVDTMTQEEYEK